MSKGMCFSGNNTKLPLLYRMANLGLIDFKLGLYIKVNVNAGQKKLKFISLTIGENGHQWAQKRPDATFGQEH